MDMIAAHSGREDDALPVVSSRPSTWLHFQEAIQAAAPRLFRIAVSILGNAEDAQDAVQETALAAWRHWQATAAHSNPEPWLTRICVNRCIDRRRRWGRLLPLRSAQDVVAQVSSPDPDLERALVRLPARQRAVIALHYHYGYSLDECAHLLGCRPGTARSHLARGLGTLRKELDDGQA